MPVVHFHPFDKKVRLRQGESILGLARRLGLPLQSDCGGKKICGKCRVIVEDSEHPLPPPSEKEVEALGPLALKGYRLACEIQPKGRATVLIPEESRIQRHVILTSQTTYGYKTRIRPNVKCYPVHVPDPELGRVSADKERLLGFLERTYRLRNLEMDFPLLRKLPHILRSGESGLFVSVRNDSEIVDILRGSAPDPFGIAFDIGTTTVVGYLMNLRTGEKVSTRSALNPQVSFGADVISRIAYAQENPDGLEKLRRAAVGCLNRIISDSVSDAGITPDRVLEATAVGNTAMHHLFVGLDPEHLAMAPYPPVVCSSQDIKARDLELNIHPSGYVHLLPLKAGFVGSDTMACILATGVHKSKTRTLLIDLGTNGEIVFGNRDRLVCCSTAAGPAFEGGHIRWGMRAASGAIERVRIDPVRMNVEVKTIDTHRPLGLCGSGIISAAAEMVRRGILLQKGEFSRKIRSPRLRRGNEGWEFLLTPRPQAGAEGDIVLTQKDISELLMAKAALYAGASLLVEMLGGGPIERILLAGACGNYVDPVDAASIDLFPGCHTARVLGVGNAAGHGSCLALLDRNRRKEVERIARKTEYVELAANTRFQDLFVSSMFFTRAVDYMRDF